jgi:quinol-cytochrome oxidoreductase complex cytochrome b subunit
MHSYFANKRRKFHGILSLRKSLFFNYALIDLFSPVNLSFIWNWGFSLGIIIVLQIIRGFLLSFHFNRGGGFERIVYIIREIELGWVIRNTHMLGASILFMILYMHIFRGIYYFSFKLTKVWFSGVLIFIIMIIVAFLGYVLPWAQIRFWAATVITNLFSSIPFFGSKIVVALWGGFSIRTGTLARFFSLHFILPVVILLVVVVHILFLHLPHSQNPLFEKGEGISFHSLFTWKDTLVVLACVLLFFFLSFFSPFVFRERDAFVEADPLTTPEHIVPEWYFLPFYAILRAIPDKLAGFIGLILVFVFIVGLSFKKRRRRSPFSFFKRFIMWTQLRLWLGLFWIGRKAVIFPFDEFGRAIVILFILVRAVFLLTV